MAPCFLGGPHGPADCSYWNDRTKIVGTFLEDGRTFSVSPKSESLFIGNLEFHQRLAMLYKLPNSKFRLAKLQD